MAGAALVIPAILLVFVAITLMETETGPLEFCLLAAGLVLLVAFILVERRVSDPLARLEVFRNVSFDIDLIAMLLVFLGLSGALSDKIGCIKPTIASQVVFAAGLFGLSYLTLDTPIAAIVPMLMFTSLGSVMF